MHADWSGNAVDIVSIKFKCCGRHWNSPTKTMRPTGSVRNTRWRCDEMDWTHTGIVTKVEGKMVHTIEGNTNDEGSREGFEVCQRIRNLDRNTLDIFKTDIAGV